MDVKGLYMAILDMPGICDTQVHLRIILCIHGYTSYIHSDDTAQATPYHAHYSNYVIDN